MGKPDCIFMLSSILLLALLGPASSVPATSLTLSEMAQSLDQHFKKILDPETATLTKLPLYIHANFTGEYQTVYPVAEAEITPDSPTNFGRLMVLDNFVTAERDRHSEIVARYQGTNTYSDFNQLAVNMNMNMIFTKGKYEGSTLTVLGRQATNEPLRVLTVVGGTGVFRFAQGIVLVETLWVENGQGSYSYLMYVVTPAEGGLQTA